METGASSFFSRVTIIPSGLGFSASLLFLAAFPLRLCLSPSQEALLVSFACWDMGLKR
jgi:hypothetical protein